MLLTHADEAETSRLAGSWITHDAHFHYAPELFELLFQVLHQCQHMSCSATVNNSHVLDTTAVSYHWCHKLFYKITSLASEILCQRHVSYTHTSAGSRGGNVLALLSKKQVPHLSCHILRMVTVQRSVLKYMAAGSEERTGTGNRLSSEGTARVQPGYSSRAPVLASRRSRVLQDLSGTAPSDCTTASTARLWPAGMSSIRLTDNLK